MKVGVSCIQYYSIHYLIHYVNELEYSGMKIIDKFRSKIKVKQTSLRVLQKYVKCLINKQHIELENSPRSRLSIYILFVTLLVAYLSS